MNGRQLAAAGMFLLWTAPSPSVAAGRWDMDASLGAGVEWTDNLFLEEEGDSRTEETVPIVSGRADLLWEERDDRLSVSYDGSYYDIEAEGEEPVWRHRLDARLAWRSLGPLFLEAADALTMVRRDTSRSGEDLFNLMKQNDLSARGGLAWEDGPTRRFELSAFGELLTFPGEEAGDEIRRWLGQAVAVTGWSPAWSTTLRLEGGRAERELAGDHDEYRVAGEAVWKASPGVSGDLGLQRRLDDPDEGSDRQYWLAAAGVRNALRGGGYVRFALEDRVEERFDGRTVETRGGLAELRLVSRAGSRLDLGFDYLRRDDRDSDGDETEWGPSAGLRWMVARNAALDAGGAWRRLDAGDRADFTQDALKIAASVIVVLGGHWTLETGYVRLRDDSEEEGRSYEANRVYALAKVYLRELKPGEVPEPFGSSWLPQGSREVGW